MSEAFDLVGIGLGPANLSLAALSCGAGLRTAFFEQRPEFRWHPGLLLEDTTLQVPFLADLVTLVDPTSPFSFMAYLRARERLFPFYFAERFHVHRVEYDDYCRWVSEQLESCHFGRRVDGVRWLPGPGLFEVDVDGEAYRARHVAVGIGTEPAVPQCLYSVLGDERVAHAADYLDRRDDLLAAPDVTVVGSGQSGAEVFLDLLRRRPARREGLRWLARTPGIAPMEYSKLGLEHFTPDYTRYFHGLDEKVRDGLLPRQWQLYKAASAETIGAIHDELYRRSLAGPADVTIHPGTTVLGATATTAGIDLDLEHGAQHEHIRIRTAAVVAATGYTERPLEPLVAELAPSLGRDANGRPMVDLDYRLVLAEPITGSVFVQNAERHTHGVGAPDLGLIAWRSATIVNAVAERTVFALPARTAFTSFGPPRTAPRMMGSATPTEGSS